MIDATGLSFYLITLNHLVIVLIIVTALRFEFYLFNFIHTTYTLIRYTESYSDSLAVNLPYLRFDR